MNEVVAFAKGEYLFESDVGTVRVVVSRDVTAEEAARAFAPLMTEARERKERSDEKRECAPCLETETRICA